MAKSLFRFWYRPAQHHFAAEKHSLFGMFENCHMFLKGDQEYWIQFAEDHKVISCIFICLIQSFYRPTWFANVCREKYVVEYIFVYCDQAQVVKFMT